MKTIIPGRKAVKKYLEDKMTSKLDKYEKDILESFQNDEWVEVPDMKNEIKKHDACHIISSSVLKANHGNPENYGSDICEFSGTEPLSYPGLIITYFFYYFLDDLLKLMYFIDKLLCIAK